MVLLSVPLPATFSLHADGDNSDVVNLSTSDPNVATAEEELAAGQTISYNNWSGTIYAAAESGTLNVGVTGFSYNKGAVVAKT